MSGRLGFLLVGSFLLSKRELTRLQSRELTRPPLPAHPNLWTQEGKS